MHQVMLRIILGLGIICGLGTGVFAQQLNVDRIKATVVEGEQWAQTFTSTEFLNIIYTDKNGILSTESGAGDDDIYFAKFQPEDGFQGTQVFAVEYVDYFGQKWYTEVEIKVVKSVINTGRDYLYIAPGDNFGTIDVLANDAKTDHIIEIVDVGPVYTGRAEITGSQSITYRPPKGFTGTTAFPYTVRDSRGTTAIGKVLVNVASGTVQSKITQLTVVNTGTIELVLQDDSFKESKDFSLVHGQLLSTSEFSYDYKPRPFSRGIEVIKFVNQAGVEHLFEIEVIDDQDDIDFVVDDKVFTTTQQYVSFDPRANDYSQEGVLVDYSPELIYSSNAFAYHPPAGFSGVKNFYYVIHDGYSAHRGEIQIFVGDYLPQRDSYDMIVQENTPHVLDYKVPVEKFNFSIVQTPSNGKLLVNQTVYSEVGGCGTVSGKELIVYIPNDNYVGTDEMVVEYCTKQGSCKEVTIRVDVKESDEVCRCIGPECVWAGDTNNDGKVSVLDLLPIGYHYGESGPARVSSGSDWMAVKSEDWLFNQKENAVNTKFADTDGNGIINKNDLTPITVNYDEYHNLVPTDVLVVKDIPLYFDVSNISAKAGDFINFNVMAGTEDLPVLDVQGLAFSIQVPPYIAEEGSLYFKFDDHSWFSYHAPVLSMVEQTGNRGRLDAAIVRIDGSSISGKGTLGSAGLAVIIDLDGAHPGEDVIPVKISLEETVVSDGAGNLYKITAQELIVNVDISGKEEDTENLLGNVEVVTYPNPTAGTLNFHANNQDELIKIDVFNMVGERVHSLKQINNRSATWTPDLSQGMYLAHIVTKKGKTVQKFQVVKN